jgi:radical SAM protein with 4Fe4S-binding SPASM domain
MDVSDERYPLEWIDDYIVRLRSFIFVREEDRLLIKVPNEAHRLNATGVQILRRLLDGEGIIDLWRSYGGTPGIRHDLYHFFVSLKQVLQGCVNESCLPEAVEQRPFSLDFNKLPVLSEVALTYRCNLRCRFCYANCSSSRSSGHDRDMDTEAVQRILHIIRYDAQTPSVSFTGGEPTLRHDLPELVGYARRSLGLRVNLITNGTLLSDALVDRLKEADLNSAQVSVEGPNAGIHDALTRAAGSFEASIDGIRRLIKAGIIVHTNTTLNRLNVEVAAEMPALVQSLGLERFSMNLVIPVAASQDPTDDLNLHYEAMPEYIIQIQEAAARHDVEFMWYSPTPVCIFNPIQHGLGNKSCAACDGLLSVSPTGDLLPCSSWPEPVGNLLEQPFRTVWESAQARKLRQKALAPPVCRNCADFALCQGACPLYWRHFGYEEIRRYGERYVAAQS